MVISAKPLIAEQPGFATMSAQRLLVFGGIGLIIAGLLLGDIFAVFILHPNADRIGQGLLAATDAVSAGTPEVVSQHFRAMGGLLENRGTKVDAHAHIIAFGYIALILAMLQPYLAFTEIARRRLAQLFITGAVLLPVSVFLIHYVGLAHSPVQSIGWASIFADFGGALVIIATAGFLWGYGKSPKQLLSAFSDEQSWSSRVLLGGGTLLILAGFIHGAYYAGIHLYEHEQREAAILRTMIERASAHDTPAAQQAVHQYGLLAGERAVAIAAHSHIIEFGLMAMLLSCVQQYLFLSEKWKRRWAMLLLAGSVVLPVFVQAEMRWGLVAGALADVGGLMVIIALLAMLAGAIRHTGATDTRSGGRP